MAGVGYRIGKLLGKQSLVGKFAILGVLAIGAFAVVRHWDAVRPFAAFVISLLVLLALLGVATGAVIRRVRGTPTGDPMACTTCGHVGPTKSHTRGQFWVEVVLWLLLLIPGIIYTVWRLSSRTDACAVCGGLDLVPPNSPVGRRIAKESANLGEGLR